MAVEQFDKRVSVMKATLLAAALAGAGLLTGCGGDSGGGSDSPKIEAKISGLVNDNAGAVSHGKIEVADKSGAVVYKGEFHDGRYQVKVPASAGYPIVITAFPPEDAAVNTPVKAVVTSSIADRIDVSPVSTSVVEGAIALGGLTAQNIARASGGAIGMRQSQGVSAASGGGGAGPGNSGGGAGRGGHGGHNMEDMKRSGDTTTETQPK